MDEFVRFLVSPLVSSPESISITSHGPVITLKVADGDVGRIIGKHGSVINALRTLVRTYAATHSLPPVNLVLDSPARPQTPDHEQE